MAKRSAGSRLNFTKTALKKLPVPAKGRQYHYDTKTPGLCLCVTATGSRTFYLYRRFDGKPTRYRIGRFPELTVEQARRETQARVGQVATGDNPHTERLAKRRELTLQAIFDHWMVYAKAHKRTWPEDKRKFDKHLAPWQSRPVSMITKADVVTLHAKIGTENGKYEANRTLAFLRSMFNEAIDDDVWTGGNPTQGIRKFPEEERERHLQADEIPRFFDALAAEPDEKFRDFFTVALFTGARRGNIQTMRWEEVDFAEAVWRIPGTKAKAGDVVTIPLVDVVLEVLRRRQKAAETEWVFTGRDGQGPLQEPRKAWKRICTQARLPDLRMHDLRRTLGSWQAATGASLPIIGKTLGHRDGSDATKVYARLNIQPVRRAVDKAAAAILDARGNGDG